jgi:hypothetical protein
MAALERELIAKVERSAGASHSGDKGMAREAFVRNFLENHLGANVAVGQGEIIDGKARPGEKRHQHDVVIYRHEFPKLDFGGSVSGFLIESVVATIEIK